MSAHIYTLRVYHQDTDAIGVVHHSNYLRYFERARTELLRELGFDLVSLHAKSDSQFVLRSVKVDFLQPARLDQILYIVSEIETLRMASLVFDQKIYLEKKEGALLCHAKIRLACIDSQFRPKGLPEKLTKGG